MPGKKRGKEKGKAKGPAKAKETPRKRKMKRALQKMNEALAAAEKAKKALEKGAKGAEGGAQQKAEGQGLKKAEETVRTQLGKAIALKSGFIYDVPDTVLGFPFWWWYQELKALDDEMERARSYVDQKDWARANQQIAVAKGRKKKMEFAVEKWSGRPTSAE